MKKRICSLLLICSMLAGLAAADRAAAGGGADTAAARDGFVCPQEEKTA